MAETKELNSAEAYMNRGEEFLNSGDYDGAIENFNLAIKLDPNYAKAYYYRGAINMERNPNLAMET